MIFPLLLSRLRIGPLTLPLRCLHLPFSQARAGAALLRSWGVEGDSAQALSSILAEESGLYVEDEGGADADWR